ncbi:hypothetical protein [Streptomyces sp. NBC_00045]
MSHVVADSGHCAASPVLAAKCGLALGRPTWLPDVISRFHLTPPPGL